MACIVQPSLQIIFALVEQKLGYKFFNEDMIVALISNLSNNKVIQKDILEFAPMVFTF